MADTRKMFLALLRSELCQMDPHDLPDLSDIDAGDPVLLESLLRLAAGQDLTHIVGAALYRLGLPRESPYAAVFKKAQINAVIRYEQMQREFTRLTKLFETIHIRCVPLKGAVLRAWYPQPEMRTSCDIDLLIPPEDVETASSALTEQLCYQRGKAGAHDVAFLSPCGVHLELHFTLMEEKSDSRIQKTLSRVWEYAFPSSERAESCVYHLRQEFVYFYHIAHMVKHFKYGGCGIRPFMDLWILEHCGPVFDTAKVEQLLMEGGILTFAEQAQLLSEAWFSGVLPGPDSCRLLDSMEDYLFAGGVYGSTENRVKVGRLEKEGKLHYLCSRLFLPYESMKYDYPILQKHRALLPLCEIHRWFRLFSGDTARRISQEVKDNSALTDEERSVMRDLFRGLGLQ